MRVLLERRLQSALGDWRPRWPASGWEHLKPTKVGAPGPAFGFGQFSILRGTTLAVRNTCRFPAYILLSGAVPGPPGAALLLSWLGCGRPGCKAGLPFFLELVPPYFEISLSTRMRHVTARIMVTAIRNG